MTVFFLTKTNLSSFRLKISNDKTWCTFLVRQKKKLRELQKEDIIASCFNLQTITSARKFFRTRTQAHKAKLRGLYSKRTNRTLQTTWKKVIAIMCLAVREMRVTKWPSVHACTPYVAWGLITIFWTSLVWNCKYMTARTTKGQHVKSRRSINISDVKKQQKRQLKFNFQ